MEKRIGLQEITRLVQKSRLESNPKVDINDFMLANYEYCSDPVMTISKADDGVIIDYAHDRTGKLVFIHDKPKCATEAFLNLFNWKENPVIAKHMTYDELGQFLAARIKDYFREGFAHRAPVQIAPKIDFFSPEDVFK